MSAFLQSRNLLAVNEKDTFRNPVTRFTHAIRSWFPLCLLVFVVRSLLLAVNGYHSPFTEGVYTPQAVLNSFVNAGE